jgi:histone H2A
VYLAAGLEYLCTEILELAGNAAHDNKTRYIVPHRLTYAIKNDEELNKISGGIMIAAGGVLLNAVLLPKSH